MKESLTGLTTRQVEKLRAQGEGGSGPAKITKSKGCIVKENVCTLFNVLNFVIAALLFAVGAYSNMLFLAIILLNLVIGIAQEFQAKKLVDELSILNRPTVRVRRDGKDVSLQLEEVVRGDLLVLESGRQVCSDAVIVEGSLEVNESLLTGESDAMVRERGSRLYSGSFVVSGKAWAKVTHVGGENYAARLVQEVKKEKKVQSELLDSMRRVTNFTSFLIVPLGVLLFLEAFFLRRSSVETAVVSSAAALLGMLPKGLVLLISVSLAAGVIRLAKRKILVQNIYSLETLAHVDTLCLDKTGTITSGTLKVCQVLPLSEETQGKEAPGEAGRGKAEQGKAERGKAEQGKTPQEKVFQGEAWRLVCAYMAACQDNNATFQAMKEAFPPGACLKTHSAESNIQTHSREEFRPVRMIPFSSKRKWGSVSFEGRGTVFVGAPERLAGGWEKEAAQDMAQAADKNGAVFRQIPPELERELEKGRRVVMVGFYGQRWDDEQRLPKGIVPWYGVVLEDVIRPGTKDTLAFFRKEGVDVKVISGDHIKTVSAIAKRAGLERWRDAVDLSALGEHPDYDAICEKYAVFARVTPRQKQKLVQALKRQGRQVAMTGDGVNDLLALREADCSIAVADGSDASRQIAQVVLLDSDFSSLPQVVMEGRKAVHHVTRTAQVFFIKTIYSLLVSVFCLIANQPFPFLPIQITLIDACIEAYPSFFTILEADTRRIRGKFLPTALAHAAPFGAAVTAVIVVLSLWSPLALGERQTVMYLLLILFSMAAVIRSCLPFNGLRTFVCFSMVAGTFFALRILQPLLELAAVTGEMSVSLAFGGVIGALVLSFWGWGRGV